VQEAETEAEEIEVGQALLDAALDGGWYDRESDGWYCPRCARDVSRPRVQMNGTDLAGY